MSDPFELLRDELVRAAERTAVASPGQGIRRPRWLRGRQGLAVAIAGLLVAGGAGAAATVLSGEQSKPLSGVVPAGQQPHTALVAGQRYTIGFAPSIQAGQIGWCVSTRTFSRSGRPRDRGTGGLQHSRGHHWPADPRHGDHCQRRRPVLCLHQQRGQRCQDRRRADRT